jgi:hypothetical protein
MSPEEVKLKEYFDACMKGMQELMEFRFDALDQRLSRMEAGGIKWNDTSTDASDALEKRVVSLEQQKAVTQAQARVYATLFGVVVIATQILVQVFVK